MSDIFTPHVAAIDVASGGVVMTTTHLGREHPVVLTAQAARELGMRLIEQAAVAEPPPRLHGAEVTEFLPSGYPEEAAA